MVNRHFGYPEQPQNRWPGFGPFSATRLSGEFCPFWWQYWSACFKMKRGWTLLQPLSTTLCFSVGTQLPTRKVYQRRNFPHVTSCGDRVGMDAKRSFAPNPTLC